MMAREVFEERYNEWIVARSGKNSRAVSDTEHALIVELCLKYDVGERRSFSLKERIWLATYSVIDFGATKKLVRRGSALEVVKTS